MGILDKFKAWTATVPTSRRASHTPRAGRDAPHAHRGRPCRLPGRPGSGPPHRGDRQDPSTEVRNSPTHPSRSRPTSGLPPTFAVFGRGTSTWWDVGLITEPG